MPSFTSTEKGNTELLLLIRSHLIDLGLNEPAEYLWNHLRSNVKDPNYLTSLISADKVIQAVLKGDFDLSLILLSKLVPSPTLDFLRYIIIRHQFFESIEEKKIDQALSLLQNKISPLLSDQKLLDHCGSSKIEGDKERIFLAQLLVKQDTTFETNSGFKSHNDAAISILSVDLPSVFHENSFKNSRYSLINYLQLHSDGYLCVPHAKRLKEIVDMIVDDNMENPSLFIGGSTISHIKAKENFEIIHTESLPEEALQMVINPQQSQIIFIHCPGNILSSYSIIKENDNVIKLKNTCRHRVLFGGKDISDYLATVSHDGSNIAIVMERTVFLLDMKTLDILGEIKTPSIMLNQAESIAFLPNQNKQLLISISQQAYSGPSLISFESDVPSIEPFKPSTAIQNHCFSYIATSCLSNYIFCFTTENRFLVYNSEGNLVNYEINLPQISNIFYLAVSSNQKYIILTCENVKGVYIIDIEKQENFHVDHFNRQAFCLTGDIFSSAFISSSVNDPENIFFITPNENYGVVNFVNLENEIQHSINIDNEDITINATCVIGKDLIFATTENPEVICIGLSGNSVIFE
eukprot:TRINITY_DN2041_c0_g1_i1.p1 TRINITY_DN2041_c0_g1~~TRINITY_DN2041_c0_g1_i1.p1  ORF type:complete len:579 (-),score=138.83 TRINITY_DN2041_c0_g1_i1:68-1804(-)